ncbi:hypothetical protein SAY87_010745 [Trapa incisa]|uniref:Glycosyltransferase family 92 protein n=1 Tax=Trapa incisa TaxID=236973 RepID=A0AAN7GHJ5_9MYRT|nr:hypothetical protein SAY87_010745 [Trapa incisa]
MAKPSASISPSPSLNSLVAYESVMRRRIRTALLLVSTALFVSLYLYLHIRLSPFVNHRSPSPAYADPDDFSYLSYITIPRFPVFTDRQQLIVIEPEPETEPESSNRSRGASISEVADGAEETAVAILFPDWEVFIVADLSSASPGEELHCIFQNNATSPARFAGSLPFSNQTTFLCLLPSSVRRLRPFSQPLISRSSRDHYPAMPNRQPRELLRWSFLAYESLSTEDDVILFVKGVNSRQGINRSPLEFNCVFFSGGDPSVSVRTAVTSSAQEVFRCAHPDLTVAALEGSEGNMEKPRIKISLEILREKRIIPTVALYAPKSASVQPTTSKSLTCASTMVYNVAKFLPEWVIYHSRIGVERFFLYDNGGDDDLRATVDELNREGYDVRTILWPWPKTQEAGFSHSAVYYRDSCTWMMYFDVDEFVYSPSWHDREQPSDQLIEWSLLPPNHSQSNIGQISINCHDFGPSGRRTHPAEGVTQGYTCRRQIEQPLEQRHKSIVRLQAVEPSLSNFIHHFILRDGYRAMQLGLEAAVVNHYKYQAWPEFQTKFRRRVSAYVVDWTQTVNPTSKDRTPGLGFKPIEPKDWTNKFCEVTDEGLKELVRRWFRRRTSSGFVMPW